LNFPAGKKLIVFCQSGKRSQLAAAKLAEQGYRSVFSLSGGLNSWLGQAKTWT
jgi:rhodanese-related sulfurtransferase